MPGLPRWWWAHRDAALIERGKYSWERWQRSFHIPYRTCAMASNTPYRITYFQIPSLSVIPHLSNIPELAYHKIYQVHISVLMRTTTLRYTGTSQWNHQQCTCCSYITPQRTRCPPYHVLPSVTYVCILTYEYSQMLRMSIDPQNGFQIIMYVFEHHHHTPWTKIDIPINLPPVDFVDILHRYTPTE